MKKPSVVLLMAAIFAFSYVNAQTGFNLPKEELSLSDFSAESVFGRLSYFAKNAKNKSKAKSVASRSAEIPFTERVRIPDVTTNKKRYYIRNVKTGKYLHYAGKESTLNTVDVPDADAAFYFDNRTLFESGSGMHMYSSADLCFYGPEGYNNTLLWGATPQKIASNPGVSDVTFYFIVSEDNSGFYISNSEAETAWTYDEDGNIVNGGFDENALWKCEALPVEPSLSTSADTVWYVVKNVENGKYLHYEGSNVAMNTVTAPDSCSLFYALLTEDGVELHNYTAGELVCQGTDGWGKTGSNFNIEPIEDGGLQYYISVSGDKSANDIWFVDNNGLLQSGAYGENSSLWEFEEITNFKEIFGLASNGVYDYSGKIEEALLDAAEKIGATTEMSIYKYFSYVYAFFQGIAFDKAFLADFDDVAKCKEMNENIVKMFSHVLLYDINEDITIHNIGYVGADGEVIKNTLATNSTLLEINNAPNAHTNVWEYILSVDNGNLNKMVFYNKAIGKYLGKPVDEDGDGEATVGFVDDIKDAGSWAPAAADDETLVEWLAIDDIINNVKLSFVIANADEGTEDYFLMLPNPNAKEVACKRINVTDEAELLEIPGLMWLAEFGTANINEKFYNHAAEAATLYPQLLQSIYGLVKNDENSFYKSCCEAQGFGSNIEYLTDYDLTTAFGTTGDGCDYEKHSLLAVLPAPTSEFYFYMKPYTEMVYGVPMNIKISGYDYDEEKDELVYVADIANVSTGTIYENMFYFSDLIKTENRPYQYIGFTVEGTNTPGDNQAFALSEFYVLPNNEKVAEASKVINEFYSKSYMGEEIIEPSVELVKLKAEYYLELNADNHSLTPVNGKYSTEKYNALKDACDNVKANDSDSVDKLIVALDEFLNSLYTEETYPIYILESAWEDGYSAGWAVGADPRKSGNNELFTLKVKVQDANIWDMRQWVAVKKSNDENVPSNYYDVHFPALKNDDDDNGHGYVYIDEIAGWKNLYSSKKPAYNISMKNEESEEDENAVAYFGFHESRNFTVFAEPATVVNRKDYCEEAGANYGAGAWYLSNAGYMTQSDYEMIVELFRTDGDYNEYVNDELFEAFAYFGIACTMADMYRTGEKKGRYVYEENNGLTKVQFEELYKMLKPYYDLGPVELALRVLRGEYSDALLADIEDVLIEIVPHFPNFKDNSSTSGMYYRMKGVASGNYVVAGLVDGTLKMMSDEDNGYDEISSVFYSTLTQNENYVQDVISYSNGRYIMAADGKVKYNAIPKYEETYTMQGCAFEWTENGYTLLLDGEHKLFDGGTAVTSQPVTTVAEGEGANNCYWELEVVEELPVKITDAGVASFYAPVELVIPEGVKAYVLYGEETTGNNSHMDVTTGQMYDSNKSVFNLKSLEGGIIPAGLPVLLAGAKGVYDFRINYERTLITDEDVKATYCYDEDIVNLLEGVVPTTYIPVRTNYIHYILSKKNDVVGMYKVKTYSSLTSSDGIVTGFEAGKESFQNNGHRAWLPMPNAMSLSAASYQFAIENRENDESTGIVESMRDDTHHEDMIFDLQGRRLEMITVRGIYIINGRRVLVK